MEYDNSRLLSLLSNINSHISSGIPDIRSIDELMLELERYRAYCKKQVAKAQLAAAERLAFDAGFASIAELISAANGPAVAASDISSRHNVRPKYSDPVTGETWSGRGQMAAWLKTKVAAGERIEDFLLPVVPGTRKRRKLANSGT